MDQRQTEYELAYWRQAKRAESDARQQKILALWEFAGAPRVMEIGTGPWGGCLPFVQAERKIGVDPLYTDYAEAGLLPAFDGYGRLCMGVEELHGLTLDEPLDAILSMNALDHGDSDFGSLAKIAALLKPGGRFYLHVHLRRPDQLNVGHDHPLRLEDLEAATKAAGLREIRRAVHETDPIEGCAYRTVIGVWEK